MGKCAPTLVRLRKELDERHPGKFLNLGCCPSSAHSKQNPKSDHEPDASGYCAALDIGEGVDHGMSWLRDLLYERADPRVRYLIYEREIWFPHSRPGHKARGKYAYTGPNAHATHLHVSIFRTHAHDTQPWLTDQEEDDLTSEEHNKLVHIEERVDHFQKFFDTLEPKIDHFQEFFNTLEPLVQRIEKGVEALQIAHGQDPKD